MDPSEIQSKPTRLENRRLGLIESVHERYRKNARSLMTPSTDLSILLSVV